MVSRRAVRVLWLGLMLGICSSTGAFSKPERAAAEVTPNDNPSGICGSRTAAWARNCTAQSRLPVTPVTCLTDRLVVKVDLGAEPALEIDITTDTPTATAHAGGLGLWPIGDFADWPAESAARRGALAALAACVQSDPPSLALERLDSSSTAEWGDFFSDRAWVVLGLSVLGLALSALWRSRPRSPAE